MSVGREILAIWAANVRDATPLNAYSPRIDVCKGQSRRLGVVMVGGIESRVSGLYFPPLRATGSGMESGWQEASALAASCRWYVYQSLFLGQQWGLPDAQSACMSALRDSKMAAAARNMRFTASLVLAHLARRSSARNSPALFIEEAVSRGM